MQNLESSFIQKVNSFLDLPDSLPNTPTPGFIFGTKYPDPAHIAANLYHQGLLPIVIVTGGSKRQNIPEAQNNAKRLVELGLTPDHILIEESSTNTIENVIYSLPILDHNIGLENLTSLIIICKWFHGKRALMTLKKYLPHTRCYLQAYSPEGIRIENWHQTEIGQRVVLKEYRVIPEYLQKGDIANLD